MISINLVYILKKLKNAASPSSLFPRWNLWNWVMVVTILGYDRFVFSPHFVQFRCLVPTNLYISRIPKCENYNNVYWSEAEKSNAKNFQYSVNILQKESFGGIGATRWRSGEPSQLFYVIYLNIFFAFLFKKVIIISHEQNVNWTALVGGPCRLGQTTRWKLN